MAFCAVSMTALISLAVCQKKSGPAAKNTEKVTLLTASNHGDLSQVEQLLREGADVNEHTSGGKTALHYAAQSKNIAVVRALIQAGADVNANA